MVKLGYAARDDLIVEIKEFLRDKIRKTSVMKYNKLFNAGIWNHFDILAENLTEVQWGLLSRNPEAIELLKANPTKINWFWLSMNSAAIDIIKNNIDDTNCTMLPFNTNPAILDLLEEFSKKDHPTNWDDCIDRFWQHVSLSSNPVCIKLLNKNPDKINWGCLCRESSSESVNLLKANPDKINWQRLSQNISPHAIKFLTEHLEECKKNQTPDKIDWKCLSENAAAINLLLTYPEKTIWKLICWFKVICTSETDKLLIAHYDKVNWAWLSKNPTAISILTSNFDKIDWCELSGNSAAIELLKANPEKIEWWRLSRNSAAIDLLNENYDCIVWNDLIENPNAIKLLIKRTNTSKYGWFSFALNLFRAHKKRDIWNWLSGIPYDYYEEKINHFNDMKMFPCSRLEL